MRPWNQTCGLTVPAGSRPGGYVAHVATPGPLATSARERDTGERRDAGATWQMASNVPTPTG
jgi:hypothetical protein